MEDIWRVVLAILASSSAAGGYWAYNPKSPASKLAAAVLVSFGAVGLYYILGPKAPSKTKMGGAKSKARPAPADEEKGALSKREYRGFKLVKRTDVTHNTRIFRFALQTSNTVLGLPVGQHMHARITRDGEVVEREYTPISYDGDVGFFDLMIKIYPKGAITQHLEHMSIGDELEFRGPRGMIIYKAPSTFFFPFSRVKEKAVSRIGMIAGGTGITPMLQILRQIERDAADNTQATLIFGNVSENDILLHDELKQVDRDNENINIHFVVDKVDEGSSWTGGVGYITPKMITELLPGPGTDALMLICGPEIMQKIMKKNLEELGFSKDEIKTF